MHYIYINLVVLYQPIIPSPPSEQDLTVDPFLPLADNYFDFVVVPAMFQLFQRPLDMFKGMSPYNLSQNTTIHKDKRFHVTHSFTRQDINTPSLPHSSPLHSTPPHPRF